MKKAPGILVVMLVAAVITAACGSEPETTTNAGGGDGAAGGPSAGGARVVASDFSFRPSELKLPPGEKAELTFVNEDSTTHSFTSEDLGVDVEAEGGSSASVSFTAPKSGAAEFHCRFHSQMTGEISVGDTKSKDATEGGQTESEDDGGAY